MPIEIRELHIKVFVKEEDVNFEENKSVNPAKLNDLKSEIIEDCTQKVLEKLKEKQER